MNPYQSDDPELDPDFDQELDALVPEAWAEPLGQEPAELISFDEFFHDVEDGPAVPESCRTDPLQEAAAELALAQKRIDQRLAKFVGSLTPAERKLMQARFSDPRHGVSHLLGPSSEVTFDPAAIEAELGRQLSGRHLRAVEPPKRRPYEPPSLRTIGSALRGPYDPDDPSRIVSTCKRTGRTTTASELARDWERALRGDGVQRAPAPGNGARRVEVLRAIARKNLGTVETMERMLDDLAELRGAEPSSLRAGEPSSCRAGDPSEGEPPSNAALPLEAWLFEPKTAPPWSMDERNRDPEGIETAGARSCRWCREEVEDEFDHDFCEPRLLDEQLTHPELGGDLRASAPLRYRENVRCACCESLVAVELVAPPGAVERGIASAVTVLCPFGTSISLAYSWRRRKVVGLRMSPPQRGSR